MQERQPKKPKETWTIMIPDAMKTGLIKFLKKGCPLETHAFLYGGFDFGQRIITVGRIKRTPENAYLERTPVSLELKPDYVINALEYARRNHFGIIDCHIHPGRIPGDFSEIDSANGFLNASWMKKAIERGDFEVAIPWGMFVIAEGGGESGWIFDYQSEEFVEAFLRSPLDFGNGSASSPVSNTMDRQVRIWGKEGQQKLGSQNVAVVGCGGTGAIACEQLARIGVYNFSLFDEDRVEDTNLNRLINAYPEHLDIMKTDVAAMAIKRINPSAVVQVNHEFISRKNLHKLAGHSIIVGAVDSEVCRLYLNDASLRYLIPYLDIGTGINIDSEGRITDLGGQVRFVNPGTTPCLRCYHNGIDALEVMLDLMGEEEHATRRQLGYVKGTDFSPAPAVLPLNSAVVSMAMLELASAVTGYGLIRSYVHYEALSNKVTVLDDEERMAPQSACPACGPGGILGLANMSHQRYVTQEEQEKLAAALAKPSKAQKTESMSDDPESVMTCGMNQYTNKLIGILTAAVGNVLMLALRKTRFIELSLQLLAARNRGSTDSLD